MAWKVLNDLVIVVHFLWIIFIIFGFLLALWCPKIIVVHVMGLVFTLVLNIGGWYCPLTHLENVLQEHLSSGSPYLGSFISNYLERIIYLEVSESHLRIGAMVWTGLNLGGYALLLVKRLKERRLGGHEL